MTQNFEIEESIHNAILTHVKEAIESYLLNRLPDGHPLKPGVVKLGPLQGDPYDPDEARIAVTLHENDPDEKDSFEWCDTPAPDEYGGIEIGGAITWLRRCTLKAQFLFELSREDLETSRRIAGAIKNRLEDILLGISFFEVNVENEYVSRGILGTGIQSKMRQGGGPPDAYQFNLQIRFEVLTTRTGVLL